VEEALDMLAARAAEKNLDLVYELADDLPSQAIGDVTRLRQILVNLVGNAIKFTTTGEISIDVKSNAILAPLGSSSDTPAPALGIRFAVRDTGIGIPPERLHRLFRSFSQVDSSITRHYGGTGLGLAISKGLVEHMGGKIWVESVEGQGSTFVFVLPLAPVPATGKTASKRRPIQLAGLRLLLVEDNAVVRQVLARLTQSWGLATIEAGTSREVLERLKRGEHFDLAVVDQQVPGELDGTKLLREMRRFAQAKSLPVLLMTSMGARNEKGDATQGEDLNSLSKPIKPAQLQRALIALISGIKPPARKVAPASKLDVALAERFPLRVLLADDNLINQKVASRLLQQMGYRADIASNGLEVIRALEQQPYDIIFMDVQMPELDGLETSRRIRQRQHGPSPHPHFHQALTIVAMTANAMQGDREKCFEAGMNDYIPKPVRPEALQAVIERFGSATAATAILDRAVGSANVSAPEGGQPCPPDVLDPSMKTGGQEGRNSSEAEPCVDFDRLMEFAGGNQETFEELIQLYLSQTRQQLAEINKAIRQGNISTAASVAHSSAGASATCGMVAIVPILRQLEQCGKVGDLELLPKLCQAAQGEFERIEVCLQKHASAKSSLQTPSSPL
jgi:CheY-like chemotaxis protein/HPt (histidine-containing phosphotransfer) domain-containing protein